MNDENEKGSREEKYSSGAFSTFWNSASCFLQKVKGLVVGFTWLPGYEG